jgi:hypothetical protein
MALTQGRTLPYVIPAKAGIQFSLGLCGDSKGTGFQPALRSFKTAKLVNDEPQVSAIRLRPEWHLL